MKNIDFMIKDRRHSCNPRAAIRLEEPGGGSLASSPNQKWRSPEQFVWIFGQRPLFQECFSGRGRRTRRSTHRKCTPDIEPSARLTRSRGHTGDDQLAGGAD